MLTFRFVAILGRLATYSTQFLFPLLKTFRYFALGAERPISLQSSAPKAPKLPRRFPTRLTAVALGRGALVAALMCSGPVLAQETLSRPVVRIPSRAL